MDKRKGIILAIVLFLIIGLGTFVFAGGSDEGSGDGTITPQPDGGDDNDPTNPSDPTTEDDGNITEGEDEEDTTRPTGGNDNTDGDELVTDGEGENNPTTPTVDYKALLDELANMVESATSKEDLAEAEQFRKDNNITEENVAALDDDAASETYDEVIAILTDNASPVVTPDDLNGSFTNKDSVAVEITDTTDVSYTLTINGEEVTDADLATLTEEGNYKLTVTDSAFNSTTITFTVDRTNPVLLVNDEEVEAGETIYVNEDAKMTVDETNLESFTSNGNDRTESILKGSWTAQNDGPYNIVVTDKAGNETTYTIIVDKTAPVVNNGNLDGAYVNHSVSLYIDEKNDYTLTVTRDGNELVGYQDNMFELSHDGVYVVTVVDAAGNETTVKFTIDNTDPVLYVNDEKVEAGETIYVNEDAKMTVDETNLESFTSNGNDRTESILKGSWTAQNDGPYNIVVTDKAGNETSYTIVRDTVKIEVNHLYVKNNTHEDYNVSEENRYKVIGNGQELYVEYVLKEEFTSTPILTIGGKEYKMTCDVASWNDELYKCDAHVTISEDMNLVNGEVIPFTITGVKDIAGNETIVTEENVTVTEKYGQVIYDNEKPIYNSLGLVNITHYIEDSKGDNLFVANVGDTLRVMISFDELLEVNPTVTLGGVTKEMHFDDAWADYSYWADIKITEDMNLTDGNIDFVISGYADAAGNVGVDLTSSNIKNSSYTGVKLDTTAPTVKFANTHGQKYYNLNYITVVVTENNLSKIYYTWGGSNKYTNATNEIAESLIKDNGDGTYTVSVPTVEGRKKLSIKAVDVAGNVYTGHSTSGWYNIDKTAAEVTVSYDPATDTNGIVTATLTANEKITIADTSWEKVSDTVYKKEYSDNATEEIVVTDRVGLETKVNVSVTNIDKVAPTVEFANTHGQKYYNKDYITVVVTENNLSKVYYAWGGSNKYTNATNEIAEDLITNNGDGTYTVSVPTVEGRKKLSIKAVDVAGNVYTGHSTSGWYNIDTINPYLEGLVSGTQAFTVSLKAVDDNFDYIKLTNNDTNQVINESREWTSFGGDVYVGKWTAQVYDKAGNVSDEYTFEILPERTTSLVDGVSYESLSDAVEAAKVSGSAVELVDDITVSTSDYIEIKNGEVNIDLNGNNIMFESSRFSISDNGTLNLTGEGTISSNVAGGGPIYLSGSTDSSATAYANLNVGKDVTVEGNNGILIFTIDGKRGNAYGVNVNIDGTVRAIDVGNAPANIGVYVTGNLRNATTNAPIITLSETARVESGGVGIYAAGYATWNINGAYIEGAESAVGIKSGILNMNSGTLKANGTLNIPTEPFGNGMNSSGAALQIESNASYVGEMEINISGGRLISENAVAIYEYGQKYIDTKVQKINITGGEFISTNYKENFLFSTSFNDTFNNGFITGGTFNRNENDALLQYIADGYTVVEQDGNYVVVAE